MRAVTSLVPQVSVKILFTAQKFTFKGLFGSMKAFYKENLFTFKSGFMVASLGIHRTFCH